MKNVLLLNLSVFLLFCSGDQQQSNGSADDPQSTEAVEAAVVKRDILIPFLEKPGIVSGVNEAVVVSETEGIIQAVEFELGDMVDSGTYLLRVERETARFALNQAKQQLSTARMNLEASRRLFEDSAVSRSEFEQAKSSFNGARAAYETALARYDNTLVRSPIRGEVATKEDGITEGNYLSPGMLIARIADVSAFRMEVAIGEGEIELIENEAQAQVRITSVSPDSVYQAEVRAVASGAQPASGSYSVVVIFENSDSLIRSGMSGRTRIRTNDRDSVMVIPSVAVVEQNDTARVFRISSGRVYENNVIVGRVSGNRTEIKAGLVPGDTIALTRTRSLEQGDSVFVSVIEEERR